jgi:Mannosyltransferase (PIG-V)
LQSRLISTSNWFRTAAGLPLVRAVLVSRLLVLAAGVYGALFTARVSGWSMVDPTRLSSSFGTVGNLLAASAVRWDSIHYLNIAAHGYKPAADTGFFPFYPLLIHALGWVVSSDVVAGLLISYASFGVALVLLHRIAREELGEKVADATVLLLAFAPLSLFFSAIYTESPFLALSVGTFYLARGGRFRWAALTAACATLTHVEGIALWAPVAFMFWEDNGRRLDLRQFRSWDAAALLLPPAAFLGLLFYFHQIGAGWLAPFTGASPTGHGHSIARIIPPNHSPDGLVRSVAGPFVTIWRAFNAGGLGIAQTLNGVHPLLPGDGNMFSVGFQNVIYLIVLLITLFTLWGTWRFLPKAYAIYATLVVLVFTMSVVSVVPLRAFDRYMLPLFPLWMMAAKWLDERKLLRVVLAVSPCLIVLYTIEFTRWVMVA